jgi:hypothetical protein
VVVDAVTIFVIANQPRTIGKLDDGPEVMKM